jgi:hypothetical protein
MDRIDSYIRQAFAKFQDVPEIQAQKEEMTDHLRDRIADAIGQGKSEKEAFDSATVTMSEAMPDLEQTLATFLRPEFRPEFQNGEKLKPHTKEVYINFYRYHRAMMLMFALALFTLAMILIGESYAHEKQWPWCENLLGLTVYSNLIIGIYVVCSIVAYIVKPDHIKRVSVSLWKLLAKYGIGVFLITVIVFLQWYATIYSNIRSSYDVDGIFLFCFFLLLFYSVFFIVFSCLGWFRQHRYMKAPDVTQDTSLAKWGLVLSAVFFTVFLIISQMFQARILGFVRQEYEHGSHGSVVIRINELLNNERRLQDQLRDTVKHLEVARWAELYMPGNARIVGDPMEYSPMTSLVPPVVHLNRKNPMLKEGLAAQVYGDSAIGIIWRVPGFKGEYKIIDTRNPFLPTFNMSSMGGSGMSGMTGMGMSSDVSMMGGMGGDIPPIDVPPMAAGMMGEPQMSDSSAVQIPMPMAAGMVAEPQMMVGVGMPPGEIVAMPVGGGMGYVLPEPKEHTLTLDSDFPAADLTESVICARRFPFEEYKLGMIQAVAPETVGSGETFCVRLGIGNLDAKNAKLLLTIEYDDTVQQEFLPSGSTLFLGFVGTREYREYKADFTAQTSGEHTIRLTLRNESGQMIAETKVTVTSD